MRALVLSCALFAAAPAQAASWDMLAGGVPGHRSLLTIDLGFASLPRVAYNYGLLNRFSLGVSAAFDYAAFTSQPVSVFTPAAAVGFPMRIEAYRGGRVSFGIKLEPGLALAFPGGGTVNFGMLLGSGFNVGVFIVDKFMVGGGIDLPITLYFTPAVQGIIPILFGPILEFHAGSIFALGLDVKLGPGINVGGGVNFAIRAAFVFGFHF